MKSNLDTTNNKKNTNRNIKTIKTICKEFGIVDTWHFSERDARID